jgi:hypothetical protein
MSYDSIDLKDKYTSIYDMKKLFILYLENNSVLINDYLTNITLENNLNNNDIIKKYKKNNKNYDIIYKNKMIIYHTINNIIDNINNVLEKILKYLKTIKDNEDDIVIIDNSLNNYFYMDNIFTIDNINFNIRKKFIYI